MATKRTPETKRIFTCITPDGEEFILGLYVSEETANRALRRMYPSDWLGLASGALEQRQPFPGEKVRHGDRWV